VFTTTTLGITGAEVRNHHHHHRYGINYRKVSAISAVPVLCGEREQKATSRESREQE
jgi:hypothetical protein